MRARKTEILSPCQFKRRNRVQWSGRSCFDNGGVRSEIFKPKRGAIRIWVTVIATSQKKNLDEPDLWMAGSTSFGVAGNLRRTSARRVNCLNKSASGNRFGQKSPRLPAAGDKRPSRRFTWPAVKFLPVTPAESERTSRLGGCLDKWFVDTRIRESIGCDSSSPRPGSRSTTRFLDRWTPHHKQTKIN